MMGLEMINDLFVKILKQKKPIKPKIIIIIIIMVKATTKL